MSTIIRIFLIIFSILTLVYMLHKIQKSQVHISDTIFWLFFSFVLILVSVFPEIAQYGAHFIGIADSSNFVFLAIIFVFLLRLFKMSITISQMNRKITILTQVLALEHAKNSQETK